MASKGQVEQDLIDQRVRDLLVQSAARNLGAPDCFSLIAKKAGCDGKTVAHLYWALVQSNDLEPIGLCRARSGNYRPISRAAADADVVRRAPEFRDEANLVMSIRQHLAQQGISTRSNLAIPGLSERPDILTEHALIECKRILRRSTAFEGVGQLLVYRTALLRSEERRLKLFTASNSVGLRSSLLVCSGVHIERSALVYLIEQSDQLQIGIASWHREDRTLRDLLTNSIVPWPTVADAL